MLYIRLRYADMLNPLADSVARWTNKFWLFTQLITCGIAAIVATFPGVALRALGNSLSQNLFTYKRGVVREKEFLGNTFSMLSWNICCVPGGYSITDGGVAPWQERIHLVVDAIYRKDADVVCLYEIMDFDAGVRLFEELKNQYAHFYFNIGAQAFGPSSGIFVASKYPINDPQFTRFPKETLVGRTKHAAKGVFAFDIPCVRLFATHLQHSEQPASPTEEEVNGRAAQMKLIIGQMRQVRNKAVVVTGDFNLDSREYRNSNWWSWLKGAIHSQEESLKTWGGDNWCARLVKKKASGPCNLDYTAYLKGTVADIRTEQLETGYNQHIYKPEVLSDHNGLYSTIELT